MAGADRAVRRDLGLCPRRIGPEQQQHGAGQPQEQEHARLAAVHRKTERAGIEGLGGIEVVDIEDGFEHMLQGLHRRLDCS